MNNADAEMAEAIQRSLQPENQIPNFGMGEDADLNKAIMASMQTGTGMNPLS